MNITYHIGKNEKMEAKNVFVALWDSTKDGSCTEDRVMIYSPIGQHGEASIDFVKNDCLECTREEYTEASSGIYTPPMYLQDFTEALDAWRDRVRGVYGRVVEVQNKGRKYIRITAENGRLMVCFVDKITGDVLFPCGFYHPALHKPVRGNIFEVGNEGVDKFGCKYLKP